MVELLLRNGANIEARDKERRTALYNAVGKGEEKVVEVLLWNKANTGAKDRNSRTAPEPTTPTPIRKLLVRTAGGESSPAVLGAAIEAASGPKKNRTVLFTKLCFVRNFVHSDSEAMPKLQRPRLL